MGNRGSRQEGAGMSPDNNWLTRGLMTMNGVNPHAYFGQQGVPGVGPGGVGSKGGPGPMPPDPMGTVPTKPGFGVMDKGMAPPMIGMNGMSKGPPVYPMRPPMAAPMAQPMAPPLPFGGPAPMRSARTY